MAACSSVRVAKQGMRMTLKEALKAMTPEQKKDESIILTQKVSVDVCIIMCIL